MPRSVILVAFAEHVSEHFRNVVRRELEELGASVKQSETGIRVASGRPGRLVGIEEYLLNEERAGRVRIEHVTERGQVLVF